MIAAAKFQIDLVFLFKHATTETENVQTNWVVVESCTGVSVCLSDGKLCYPLILIRKDANGAEVN